MSLEKIDVSAIHVGVCFSEPVYFDDGRNMFLPAGKKAKPYHVSALEQWKIPYLLSSGHEIDPKDFRAPTFDQEVKLIKEQNSSKVAELGEIEDIETLDDVEEL